MAGHIESGIYNIHPGDNGNWLAERPEIIVETDAGGRLFMLVTGGPGLGIVQDDGSIAREFIETHRWLYATYKDTRVYVLTQDDGRLRIFITDRELRP